MSVLYVLNFLYELSLVLQYIGFYFVLYVLIILSELSLVLQKIGF